MRKELQLFLQQHKQLQYLGLVHSEMCSEECFVNPKHPDYNPSLQVLLRNNYYFKNMTLVNSTKG